MADTEYDVTVSVNESVNADVGATQVQGSQQIDDEVLNLSAELPEELLVDANITITEALDVTAEENTGGTDDHRKLLHKDAQDQHPITSITGLQSALGTINSTLTTHGVDITTATTSAGNAMTRADYAADEIDNVKPIVADITDNQLVDIRTTALDNFTELDAKATNIANGSLVLNGFASFSESTGTINLYTASNKLTLRGDAIVFSRNGYEIAYIEAFGNTSCIRIDNIVVPYLYMRSPNGVGNLTWIANSNGHLSLKRT